MRYRPHLLAATLLILGAGGAVFAAEPAAVAGAPQPAARHDGRWATDATLRAQMAELRARVERALEARTDAPFTDADYRAFGAEVKARVERIIATCELPPAADAAFHPVLAELLAGATRIADPGDQAHAEGMRRIVAALDDYGRRFRHPGWRPLRS